MSTDEDNDLENIKETKKKQRRVTGYLPAGDIGEMVALVNGKEVKVTKCRTCNLWRPPRSFHCSDCGACIEVHDHHCPWVGTCVGKRNHRYFFLFTLMTTVHAILTALINLVYIVMDKYGEEAEDEWNTDHLISLALLIFCTLITCCVGGLMGYHGYLACEGVTTNEEIRGKFSGSENPYNYGCKANCSAFWFGGTSRVYTEAFYDTEVLSITEPNVFVIQAESALVATE